MPVSGVVKQADGSYAPYAVNVPAKTYYQANFGRNNNVHSANIYDASYIYLREVTLGYQLPRHGRIKSTPIILLFHCTAETYG
ncbi:hypothetical protein KRR40_26515 [Niabella defluvii]|nr:hypothetical protein KRR40_26515 [Niabella sp. I65]